VLRESQRAQQTVVDVALGHEEDPPAAVVGPLRLRHTVGADPSRGTAVGGGKELARLVVDAVWTDTRDLVPGTDPRGTAKPGGVDTFDGAQTCTWVPNDINAPAFSSPSIGDPCLSAGGLDQNIYVARLP
jgi:hypothetical protein